MHVMVDIQPAVGPGAGIGRYVRSLLGPLAAQRRPEDRLSLFYFDFRRRGVPPLPAGAEVRAHRWIPGRIVQRAWRTFRAPPFDWFSGPADLFHFTNFVTRPLRRGRSVVSIHDASFLRHPETLEPKNLAFLTRHIRRSVETADAIITISRFTADELHALLDVPREKLHPIHLGLGEHLAPPSPDGITAARKVLRLDRPYLLHVGTLEPRKNLTLLVDAFERLDRADLDLVLAGKPGWHTGPILARIEASPLRDRIRRLDFVPEAHLAGLYGGASLYVCPTLYEGFGFTPLEAMRCGVPVVASRSSCLPEVLGDAPVWVDGYDAGDWTDVLRQTLDDEAAQAVARERGLAQAAGYTWAATAAAHWDVYRKVLA